MKLLLDTHVWIWSQENPGKLGRRTKKLLLSPRNKNCICTVSTLEIARLLHMGGISLSIPLSEWVRQSLLELGAETIPIDHELAMEAYGLPGDFHADPADRLLVATARRYGLTLVTADDRILSYPELGTQNAKQ